MQASYGQILHKSEMILQFVFFAHNQWSGGIYNGILQRAYQTILGNWIFFREDDSALLHNAGQSSCSGTVLE